MGLRLQPPALGQADPGFVVVGAYPHDASAFTEGLAFRRGVLFEGTGLDGESELRRVELATGVVTRTRALGDKYFGEGITALGRKLFQLTFQTHRGWAYEASTFKRLATFSYRGEGWGLTDHGGELVMSNGTDVIRFRDPETFAVTRAIHVTDGGDPVGSLNELEWVEGEIFANVFPTDEIVRIDPATGDVIGRLDLSTLHEQEGEACSTEVTNGIAYLSGEQRLFVTGKYWCHVYEIVLTGQPSPSPSPTG